MTKALVDSSAWLDFFRGMAEAVRRLDPLLDEGRAVVTGPISAEVLSGARSNAEYGLLRRLLVGLPSAAEPPELWSRVGEHRYALARRGFQAGLIDLTIALTAFECGLRLLTRDRDFERIRTVVPIELDLF